MGNERLIALEDPAATAGFGRRLAAQLRAGDVILLKGELGAGKTTLARAVIAALCGVDDAPSPTYTLVQTYETENGTPLWHADLYRIEDAAELEELGLDDAFDDAITLVEWPDRLGDWLPADRLEISIGASADALDTSRRARLTGWGKWDGRLDDL